MIHIGKKIEEKISELRINVTDFAKSINTSRTNVYDIFERETIDTGLLFKISQVLNHNFFHYYIDPVENNKEVEDLSKKLQVAEQEIKYLKTINEFLEKEKKQNE